MSHCCGGKDEHVVLSVSGMTCGHCSQAVKDALKRIDGVSGADVDLNAKKVSVSFDPGKTDLGTIKDAITDAGYTVES